MNSFEFGFIGVGNMGGALAQAACRALPPERIALSNRTAEKATALAKTLHCEALPVEAAARESRFLFLGVKPQMMAGLLSGLQPVLAARKERFVLVTMAAGLSIAQIRQLAGADYPVIRIMPNTPVSVGEGLILYTRSPEVTDGELEDFLKGLSAAGTLSELPETLIDAGSALSGCGPAYVCLFAEALADGGVACGLPRQKALLYAAQTLLGTARLLLETGEHPGALKDAVCSPGGSTIAGVRALEQGAFRASAMQAVETAFARTKQLGK